MAVNGTVNTLSEKDVPLRTGPPTKAELLVYYPAKFTWHQLKTFINSGDLGLLKRDKLLQQRYNLWAQDIRKEYGSLVNYLLLRRLQWGKPDTQSLLSSALDDHSSDEWTNESIRINSPEDVATDAAAVIFKESPSLPPIPAGAPEHFTAETSPELISIILNDWPYSVPPEIEHTLVWTRLPIIHPSIVPPQVADRIKQDGLWGFTGAPKDSPPPSPSTLPECLPSLQEWGVTMDKLVRSQSASEEEQLMVKKAGSEVDKFVRQRWNEREWETAWFVNPPRLQSVPGLAHIHVFARHKSLEEITREED